MNTNIELYVENLGPVKRADVKLKPLTVFIGRNNTGKSYTAMMYYALVRSLRRVMFDTVVYLYLPRKPGWLRHIVGLRDTIDAVAAALGELDREEVREEKLDRIVARLEGVLRDSTPVLRRVLQGALQEALQREIERVYSARIDEIVRVGADRLFVRLCCTSAAARLALELGWGKGRLEVSVNLDVVDFREAARVFADKLLSTLRRWRAAGGGVSEADVAFALLDAFSGVLLRECYASVHYLPASRAGLLQGYRAIASAVLSLAPLAAIRGVEIPSFTGPSADFLATLVSIEPREGVRPRRDKPMQFLEESILEGSVEVLRESPEKPPLMLYKSGDLSIPLIRSSSMIGELAPLDIYLRRGIVGEGDTLIIEEPEAHLHPEKQARIAELFALLVNTMNVRLVVTTHSDTLLAKLSNLVSLGSLPRVEIEKLGYSESIALKPSHVAVYHFVRTEDGVVAEEVPVSEEGIPDDAFRHVIEELYREALDVYYAVQRAAKGRA